MASQALGLVKNRLMSCVVATGLTAFLAALLAFEAFESLFPATIAAATALIGVVFYQERLARRLQISEDQRHLAAFVSNSSDAIISYRPEDGIVSWNRAAEALFGYSEAEALGKSKLELIVLPHKAQESSALINRVLRGEHVIEVDTQRRHKNGQILSVSVSLTPIKDDQGNVVLIVESLHDISSLKAVEHRAHTMNLKLANQLAEQTQMLQTTRLDVEQAAQAKTHFMTNISHEIRTPLNAVLGMTRLLESTALSSMQRKYITMLKSSSGVLQDLINDLLDFAKLSADRFALNAQDFDLGDVVDSVATLMAGQASDKGLELVIYQDPSLPTRLHGDSARLLQIMLHLVSNAITFTERGEVLLVLERQDSVEADGIVMAITVKDTGIGIAPDQHIEIFKPFTQVDNRLSRPFGGSGLGLTIAQSLANLMSGNLTVRSKLGVGSEFSANILLSPCATPDELVHNAPTLEALRVLVIEDNDSSRQSVCDTLASWQWEVYGATHAEAVLADYGPDSTLSPPDVVLVGFASHEVADLTTLRPLREQLNPSNTTWIVMGRTAEQSTLVQAFESGDIDGLLMKPVTASRLHETIQEARRAADARTPSILSSASLGQRPLALARILVAEDNVMNQVVVRSFLEQLGAKVEMVTNGQEAVEELRRYPKAHNVVLMDLHMPLMDGLQATRTIREALGMPDLPILAMSTSTLASEHAECLAAGMQGVITKPIAMEQLLKSLSAVLPEAAPATSTAPPTAPTHPAVSPKKPAEPTQRPEKAPLFDAKVLCPPGLDDPEHLNKISGLLKAATDAGVKPLQAIETLCNEGQFDEAARTLDTLRGTLGLLGATRFAQETHAAEEAVKSMSMLAIPDELDKLSSTLRATLAEAREWLSQHAA